MLPSAAKKKQECGPRVKNCTNVVDVINIMVNGKRPWFRNREGRRDFLSETSTAGSCRISFSEFRAKGV